MTMRTGMIFVCSYKLRKNTLNNDNSYDNKNVMSNRGDIVGSDSEKGRRWMIKFMKARTMLISQMGFLN